MRITPFKIAVLVSIAAMGLLLVLLWPVTGSQAPVPAVADNKPAPTDTQSARPHAPHPSHPTEQAQAARLEPDIHEAVTALTNTSSEGLVEEIDATGEGYSVNLQGRFKTVPVATVGADGQITIQEFSAPPPVDAPP